MDTEKCQQTLRTKRQRYTGAHTGKVKAFKQRKDSGAWCIPASTATGLQASPPFPRESEPVAFGVAKWIVPFALGGDTTVLTMTHDASRDYLVKHGDRVSRNV